MLSAGRFNVAQHLLARRELLLPQHNLLAKFASMWMFIECTLNGLSIGQNLGQLASSKLGNPSTYHRCLTQTTRRIERCSLLVCLGTRELTRCLPVPVACREHGRMIRTQLFSRLACS